MFSSLPPSSRCGIPLISADMLLSPLCSCKTPSLKSSTARCLSSLLLWVLLVPSPGGAPLRGPSTVRPASRPRRPPGREAPPYHTGSRALATHPGMHRRTPAALHHSRDSMSCLLQSGDAPGPPLAHADQSAAQETDSFLQSAIASTKQNVHLLSI